MHTENDAVRAAAEERLEDMDYLLSDILKHDGVDPENEGADPENADVDPENDGVDTQKADVDPENDSVDPEHDFMHLKN
ncbi:unnamed protein product [Didymodactylos carnosus]|uniref:Uncharacterized protein n=1 Tax=Didymodactylos carnosus TaxID=1234261 RepID=A0A815V696_9BILA|nr:unnamed protein product [Didymodactylos carnosus]CAF1525202.1 unnamed protein product [Didymodactylos carnosus]CAF3913060.1 unnamed protein product [Didymodactylos carnosus]CAF4384156.1 unnamed protein product [Didymodactylos carnosus]